MIKATGKQKHRMPFCCASNPLNQDRLAEGRLSGFRKRGLANRVSPFFLKMKRKKTEKKEENGKNGKTRKKTKENGKKRKKSEPEKTAKTEKNGKKRTKRKKTEKKKRKKTEKKRKKSEATPFRRPLLRNPETCGLITEVSKTGSAKW